MSDKRKDRLLKRYFANNARFADLLNGTCFQGRQIVGEDDLADMDSCVGNLHRDLVRKTAFGVNFAVIGIENQSQVHYLMPLRVMNYDAAEYKRQADTIGKKRKEKGHLTDAEFLSGFGKEDRLHPCITIVLFYGEDWDGSVDLHGLMDFTDIPKDIWELVGNYPMNLLEIRKLEQTDVYRTDIKQVFDFIRYSGDKKHLRAMVSEDAAYHQLAEDAYDVAVEFTGAKELMDVKEAFLKGGEVNMCQALTEMLQDERAEGREEGREEGRLEERVRIMNDLVQEGVLGLQDALERLEMSEEEFKERSNILGLPV